MTVLAAMRRARDAAAKAATTTIPIVFVTGDDPVGAGLVASLTRPGGNMTGVSILNTALASKRLELLHEIVPDAARVAILVNRNNPSALASANSAGRRCAPARTAAWRRSAPAPISDLEAVFATMGKRRVGAALADERRALYRRQRADSSALAARHAMPTIYVVASLPMPAA